MKNTKKFSFVTAVLVVVSLAFIGAGAPDSVVLRRKLMETNNSV